jgi:hypothetical protein
MQSSGTIKSANRSDPAPKYGASASLNAQPIPVRLPAEANDVDPARPPQV